jgi:peptidyl-prolyl cis-trans isomerase C
MLSDAIPRPKTISVNGVVIPRDVIAREVQNHPAERPIIAWQSAARALVVRELLMQEVARLGVAALPRDDAEGRTEAPEEAAMRALIEREVATPEPEEAACRRFYEQNSRRFRTGDLFEAAHILVAAPDDVAVRTEARTVADGILAAVRSEPARFPDLARERSDCRTSAQDGGHLGQITQGETVPEFIAGLERMEAGGLAIIETRYGFHIVRLDRRIDGRALPFETVRERIADYLAASVRRKALAQYVEILAGRATIVGISFDRAETPLVQ